MIMSQSKPLRMIMSQSKPLRMIMSQSKPLRMIMSQSEPLRMIMSQSHQINKHTYNILRPAIHREVYCQFLNMFSAWVVCFLI
jgi:hypothetical protein